jgi:hypothetical protein
VATSLEQLVRAVTELVGTMDVSPAPAPVRVSPVRQPKALPSLAPAALAESAAEAVPVELQPTAAAGEGELGPSIPSGLINNFFGTPAQMPLPSLPALPVSSGASPSSTISGAGQSGSAAMLLAVFAALVLVAGRPLQRQSLRIPTGIVLAIPLPPG